MSEPTSGCDWCAGLLDACPACHDRSGSPQPTGAAPGDLKPGLYTCDGTGCDFSTDDAGALAVHDLAAHGIQLREVRVPPLLAALPAPEFCGHCGIAGPDLLLGALGYARVVLTAAGRNEHDGSQVVVFVPLHRSPLCNTEEGLREALAKLAAGIGCASFTVHAELPTMEKSCAEVPRG